MASKQSGNRAPSNPKDGSFYSTEKAEAYIKPTLGQVVDRIKADRLPLDETYIVNIQRWMTRMEKGNRVDDRTPIYGSIPRGAVVKMFDKVVRKNYRLVTATGIPYYPDAFDEVEAGQKENIGPQSVFLPFSLDGPDKVKAVMSDKTPKDNFNWGAFAKACEFISNLLPQGSVHHISVAEALRGMGGNPKYALDGDTSACYPFWTHKWYAPTSDGRSEAAVFAQDFLVNQAQEFVKSAERAKSYREITPHFVGTASQRTVQKGPEPLKRKEGKPLKGKRIVIAQPKLNTIAGKTVMAPLQAALSQVRYGPAGIRLIPAWQPAPVLDKNIELFLRYSHDHHWTPVSGDISSFDATLPPWAMWEVARAMSKWFDDATRRIFLAIMYADIYQTSVITPSGIVPEGPSSVKSGSIFTSLIGCMANFAIQLYGHYCGYYTLVLCCVMGDDFICAGPGLDQYSISAAFADFKMECNPTKQFVRPDMVHFLQKLYVLGKPGGQGSIYRIMGNTLSVEDDTQLNYDERNKYAFIFQALARLENAHFNPLFEPLVHFESLGDKYSLGANMSLAEIVHGAGDYVKRRAKTAEKKAGTAENMGIPFERWSVNRVLRGEKLPPPGYACFKSVYGVSFDAVAA